MKRLTLILALVLCLAVCVFAFASCNKDKKDTSTTAKPATTAAPTTTAAPATTTAEPEDTEEPHVHVIPDEWEDEYLVEPDCTHEGTRVKYCPECGDVVATEQVPAVPGAHKVAEWTVTSPVDLFHTTGSRNGVCTACGDTIVEEIKFQPTIEAFTVSSGKYDAEKVYFSDIRGDKHFYPTESDPEGNDLLVEYSILWNESIANFDATADCYICGRFDGSKPLYYYSPVAGCPTSDANVAGAFEWMGNFKTTVSDDEVTTPSSMMSPSSNYADYPNIMGADPDHPEYGWHRIGIRYHMDLIEGKSGADLKDYVGTVTVYLDGTAIYKLSTGSLGMQVWESNLFRAETDEEDHVTYSDVDAGLIPFQINRARAKSDTTVYLALADMSVTCGKTFVMPVEKVASPEAATLTVADDVDLPAPIFFRPVEN